MDNKLNLNGLNLNIAFPLNVTSYDLLITFLIRFVLFSLPVFRCFADVITHIFFIAAASPFASMSDFNLLSIVTQLYHHVFSVHKKLIVFPNGLIWNELLIGIGSLLQDIHFFGLIHKICIDFKNKNFKMDYIYGTNSTVAHVRWDHFTRLWIAKSLPIFGLNWHISLN